jgi:hypothetical protein
MAASVVVGRPSLIRSATVIEGSCYQCFLLAVIGNHG